MKSVLMPVFIVSLMIGGGLFAFGEKVSNSTAQIKLENDKDKADEKYYYEMPKKKMKAFIKKVYKLKKGCSIEEVIKKLGKPDSEAYIWNKVEEYPRGRTLIYYFKKMWEDDVNEIKDKYVYIVFDKDDKMVKYEIVK